MRTIILHRSLCAVAVAAAGWTLNARAVDGTNGTLTLSQALQRALRRNGVLEGATWRVRVAEADVWQAGLPPNPTLEFEIDEIAGSGSRTGFDAAEITVAISQPIELGGKAGKRRAVAGYGKTLAEWDLEALRIDLTARVAKAFAQLLAAQDAVVLARDGVSLAKRLYDTVDLRVQAGKDAPVERNNAEIALAKARLHEEDALANLGVARGSLTATWGGTTPAFSHAEGVLEVPAAIPPLGAVYERATDSPAFKRWETALRQLEAQKCLTDAQPIPDVDLLGGFKQFEGDSESAFVVGVSLPLPLFDRNQGERAAARFRLASSRAVQGQATADLMAELREAYGRLSTAHRRAVAFEKSILPGARVAYETFTKGYAEGKFGLLQVLDAQRTLLDARQELLAAKTAYHTAKAESERLVGRSLDSVQRTMSTEGTHNE